MLQMLRSVKPWWGWTGRNQGRCSPRRRRNVSGWRTIFINTNLVHLCSQICHFSNCNFNHVWSSSGKESGGVFYSPPSSHSWWASSPFLLCGLSLPSAVERWQVMIVILWSWSKWWSKGQWWRNLAMKTKQTQDTNWQKGYVKDMKGNSHGGTWQ